MGSKQISSIVVLILVLAVTLAVFMRHYKMQQAQKTPQEQRGVTSEEFHNAISSSKSVLPAFFLLEPPTEKVVEKIAQDIELRLKPKKGEEYRITLPASIMAQTRRGGNNCLFDAMICSLSARDASGKILCSQGLREHCDEILKSENMPIIPTGEPAGEQYLQALSKVFKCGISVMRGGSHIATIRHSDVPETSPETTIRHMGAALCGHWTA